MRIFIGLNEIAGYYSGLKKGFDEIGVESNFVTIKDHRFNYHANEASNFLIKAIKRANKSNATLQSSRAKKFRHALINKTLLLPLFVWALWKHDVFIFGQMSTFFNYKELWILKLFGKKIIHVFHGGDTRPPYICGSFVLTFSEWNTERWIEYTRQRKEAIKTIERYSDAVLGLLAFAQLAEKPFVSVLRVGLPIVPNKIRSGVNSAERSATRIIHCPSDLQFKGTDRIRRAVANLKAKGYQLEFVEITNQPNQTALEEIAKSDFVIDQLYSDSPMASVATEAAFLGKPSVIGGYAPEIIIQALGGEEMSPSIFCHPDELEKTIEALLLDKDLTRKLGEKARRFVEENWAPSKVAERYLRIINDDVPDSWIFEPRSCRHVHGCGLSEEKAKEMVRNMIERGGREALQLSDKPELEAMFVEFAYS
jgi:glycosyltransferase involved in cell wall biosynthesis